MGNIFSSKKPSSSNQNFNSNNDQYDVGVTTNSQQADKSGTLRLISKESNDKVVAVIVTFCCSGSYDNLFTTVEQKSLEGTRVIVYACDSGYLGKLIQAFQGHPQDDIAKGLINYLKEVDSDCVVFNWECCGGYANKSFPEGKDSLFKFLKMMIDKGYMTMFSDFSLKALINQWDKSILGPNPFNQTSQYSGQFQLRFKPSVLKECPSAQLQIIGDMAEGGRCNVTGAGGTIVYTVDQDKIKHQHFTVEVLTVVANLAQTNENLTCQIGEFKGSAGHVLLKYPSGGMILTSMGHWIQLMQVDTSEKKLFQVAEKEYGASYAMNMKAEYEAMDMVQQKQYISSNARQFVRNQAPCKNMNKKSK